MSECELSLLRDTPPSKQGVAGSSPAGIAICINTLTAITGRRFYKSLQTPIVDVLPSCIRAFPFQDRGSPELSSPVSAEPQAYQVSQHLTVAKQNSRRFGYPAEGDPTRYLDWLTSSASYASFGAASIAWRVTTWGGMPSAIASFDQRTRAILLRTIATNLLVNALADGLAVGCGAAAPGKGWLRGYQEHASSRTRSADGPTIKRQRALGLCRQLRRGALEFGVPSSTLPP